MITFRKYCVSYVFVSFHVICILKHKNNVNIQGDNFKCATIENSLMINFTKMFTWVTLPYFYRIEKILHQIYKNRPPSSNMMDNYKTLTETPVWYGFFGFKIQFL